MPALGRLAVAGIVAGAATASLLAHDPITTRVSWEREIAPIVRARCVSCHSPGGPAPMSLATYKEVRPWARAIREEVLARRMPKWPVVRGYGDFTNDPSLSPFEVALITAWVDGGAPEFVVRPGAVSRPTPPPEPPAAPSPPDRVTEKIVACGNAAVPKGTLVGLEPVLEAGASIEVILAHPDGLEEPLLWLRGYDPAFPQRYWLRRPVEIRARTRLDVSSSGPGTCRLRLLFGDTKTLRDTKGTKKRH